MGHPDWLDGKMDALNERSSWGGHDYIGVSSAGKKIVDTLNTIPALRSTHSAFDGFQGKHLYHSSPSPERLTVNTKHISNPNAFSLPESKCCPEH